MVLLLLACTELFGDTAPVRTAVIPPTREGAFLMAQPVVSLQPAPARFTARLDPDLDAFVDAPWALPPRERVVDGLCFDHPDLRAAVAEDLAGIADPSEVWGEWTGLLRTCVHPEWCDWAVTTAGALGDTGRLFQPALARCGAEAHPVFDGPHGLLWSALDWYDHRSFLAAGEPEPLLWDVVDQAMLDPDIADPWIAGALRGWDDPRAAERLLVLHDRAVDRTGIALAMTRQSHRRARALADAACDAHPDDQRCAPWWRDPGSDWATPLIEGRVAATALVDALGDRPPVRAGLAECARRTLLSWDHQRAGACLAALGGIARPRAAAILADADGPFDGHPLATLAAEVRTPLEDVAAELRALGFLQGEPRLGVHGAPTSVDLLVQHGDAVVLTYDYAATYVRRLLWAAGVHDVPVDTVTSRHPDGTSIATHAWMDGRRYRVVTDARGDGWQSVELAVGLVNRLLADRDDPRRFALVAGWPAPAVLGTPEVLAALPGVTGIAWRDEEPALWAPVEPADPAGDTDTDVPL